MKKRVNFLICFLLVASFVVLSNYGVEAKRLKLKPKYYITDGRRNCSVKLTKKRLTLKKFDICPARDGWYVMQNGNTSFKLAKKCKFYNDIKRVSFKKIKRQLKKYPKDIYSFKINSKNRVTVIRYYHSPY